MQTSPGIPSFRRILLAGAAVTALSAGAHAQEAANDPPRDTIIVVGSQIQGAKVTEALPVTVVTSEDLESIAAASGDDLFRAIPQLGEVSFNTTQTLGSINDARGDTASINLRALGTGNTLVLLNGRRMVNHPGTQSENQVPVVTVNTNAIPVMGLSRVEVLLDGASAIYGADAVAGVVNNVLKRELDGFTAELSYGQEDGVQAAEFSGSFELGVNSDDGRTNISIFGSYYNRGPIFASERDFTANADHRGRLPSDWAGQSQFDNTATTSAWGGFDRVSAGNIVVNGVAVTNAAGQFHIQPDTLPGCLASLGNGICIDDTITRDAALRYNVNGPTSVSNGVERTNLFAFLNHDFTDNLSMFAEAGVYLADSIGYREATPMLGAVPIVIPSTNYYNPFGAVGSPNRLAGYAGPALDILLNGYRTVDAGPSRIDVENFSSRWLAGLRGDLAGWDWESAFLYTDARTTDSSNRVSNTLFQEALARSTPDAYNPFNGGCLGDVQNGDCTPNSQDVIDSITVQVYRQNATSLTSWDARVSRPDLLAIWGGGEIGVAAGVELRRETFSDDRDPRLDGSVTFVDMVSPGTPTSDVMGNNGTQDTKGARDSQSAFVEFAVPLVSPQMNIPLVQAIDLQVAARFENFDEFGSVTKPKVALSWRPTDFLLFRSSWSEGFRAPNLQQQFETGLIRSQNRTDFILCEAAVRRGDIPSFATNCPAVTGSTQSVVSSRAGSLDLKPEESTNLTAGIVLESSFLPTEYGRVTLTADWWRVEQENIVGIFGDFNQILLDYVLRVQGSSNPAVVRGAPTQEIIDAFAGTGLTPAGEIQFVDDNYLNIDAREVEGVDLGLYYQIDDTPLGDFNFRINGAYLTTFFQDVSPTGQIINAAIADGLAPSQLTVAGEGDLIRRGGRPEWRYSSSLTWRNGAWGAGWFTSYVGDVESPNIVRVSDNAVWRIEDYQTHNLYVQYTLGQGTDKPTRLRLGMRNITDEQPPLADTNFGYDGSLHSPAGRFVYGSVRKTF